MKAEYRAKGTVRLFGEFDTQKECVKQLASIGVHPHNMVIDGKEPFKPKETVIKVKEPGQTTNKRTGKATDKKKPSSTKKG